jgi:hypothetical protein
MTCDVKFIRRRWRLVDSASAVKYVRSSGSRRAKFTAWSGEGNLKSGDRDMPSLKISAWTPPHKFKALQPREQLATRAASVVASVPKIPSPVISGPLICNGPARPTGTGTNPMKFSIMTFEDLSLCSVMCGNSDRSKDRNLFPDNRKELMSKQVRERKENLFGVRNLEEEFRL